MVEYIERSAVLAKRTIMIEYDEGGWDAKAEVVRVKDIKMIPSADVAPVVHGEWVVCGDGDNVPWMCSHCGKTTAHKYKVMYGNYCPNCGAKMDKEEV